MSYKLKNIAYKKKLNQSFTEALVVVEKQNFAAKFSTIFKRHLLIMINKRHAYIGGGTLVIGSFLANVLNYIFNAYLGRVLSFSDFALIGLISGFFSFSTIFFGSYTFTINYSSSFLIGKYGDSSVYPFWQYMQKKAIILALLFVSIWLLITPFLMRFFHTDNVFLFILFSIVILIGFSTSINQGILASKLLFSSLTIFALADPLVKLIITYGLVSSGFKEWAFAAMILSFFVAFLISWLLVINKVRKEATSITTSKTLHFPKKLFLLSIISGFSSVAYFTFDIFLAKHFLTSTQAGEYTLVSLVGKMVFFLGNLTAPFVTPLISRYEGAKKNSLHTLYYLITATILFTFIGFLLFGILSPFTIPLLYGKKALSIISYLLPFTFGMACYTISGVLVNYYLIRKVYSLTIITSLLVLLQIVLISFFHGSVQSIVDVMSVVLILNLLVAILLHIKVEQVKHFENFLTSSIAIFINKQLYDVDQFSFLYYRIQRILIRRHK
ncbi:MAG TPA: hypothetical protein VNW29_01895 [Candidatus Sulfotelmatobacter sp.]|jgi:O-antigen/teichoic acid export membrane protein|nr:hypothetical protein [Candidatus Sulfotelmatobacter sp.]